LTSSWLEDAGLPRYRTAELGISGAVSQTAKLTHRANWYATGKGATSSECHISALVLLSSPKNTFTCYFCYGSGGR
jgi:hypothetical protein|uniref:hypothetical protein n=1 Tax=Haloquadratum walsbyi TaxID=293091 RepID=UPI001AD91A54